MDTSITDTPLVSIMMTTYNRGEYITAAIDSVRKQTYQNWELLILDDASTDNTQALLANYAGDRRIIFLPTERNLGITKNRNRGFAIAKGKYIAVLDSDDLWIDTSKLEKQVQFLEEQPEYVAVGTNVKVIDGDGKETGSFIYALHDHAIRRHLLLRNQFTHSSLLLRSGALDKATPYDENVLIWEDYDLILRLGTKGKLANLPEKMTAYRKHSTNISKTTSQNRALVHLSIIKKYRGSYPNYYLALFKSYLRFLTNLA